MAKKKVKLSIIPLAIALVAMILAVVGVFLDWLSYEAESILGNASSAVTLGDLVDGEGYTIMAISAYVTMGLAALTFLIIAVQQFMKLPKLGGLAALTGFIAIIGAIAVVVTTIVFCSNNGDVSLGSLANGKFVWSIGPIMVTLGGLVSGVAGLKSRN